MHIKHFISLLMLVSLNCVGQYSIKGKLIDRETNTPISKVQISLIGVDASSHITYSDDSGNYAFTSSDLKPIKYVMVVNDSNYCDQRLKGLLNPCTTFKVDFAEESKVERDMLLKKIPIEIIFPTFYFEPKLVMFSVQSNISQIDSLAKILSENNKMVIQLNGIISGISLSDSVLGLYRANFIKSHLVKRQINPERIVISVAVGKESLLNAVECEVVSNNFGQAEMEQDSNHNSIEIFVIPGLAIDSGDFSNVEISIYKQNKKTLFLSSKNKFKNNGIVATVQKDSVQGKLLDVLTFKFKCEYQNDFIFKFKKKGYVEKDVEFSTVIPTNAIKDGFDPYSFYVTLKKQPLNRKIKYNAAIAKISYNKEIDDFDYDTNYQLK